MMLKQEQEHVGFLAPNTVAHSGVQNVSMSPSFRGSKLSLDLASGSNMLFFAFLVILAAILLAVFFVYEVPRIVRLFRVDEANADARKEKEDVSPGSESAESSDEDYDYFAPNRHQLRPKDGKKVEKSSSGNTVATFPDDPASSGWFGSSTNPTGSLEKKDKDSTRASNELSSRLSKENLVAKAGSPSSKEQLCWITGDRLPCCENRAFPEPVPLTTLGTALTGIEKQETPKLEKDGGDAKKHVLLDFLGACNRGFFGPRRRQKRTSRT
eukprot:GEMP01054731.1.p1 GENE.GEMP01054731.1~~GEMP01054731.1.p1  ORF type:complete len:269 (+),score=57.16 GEMP01054731.1:547-1353(+)